MSNSNKIIALLGLVGLVIGQAVIRTVGMENISAQVFDTVLLIICIGTVISLYKNKEKGYGIKYNITVAILMVVMCLTSGITITMIKCYPIQTEKHAILLLILSLGGFFTFIIYLIAAKIYFELKERKKHK